MRAVIQRVSRAEVKIDNEIVGSIGRGLLVLLGVAKNDSADDVDYIAQKLAKLRIFEDSEGKMNLGLSDIQGEALIVSQFTLFASTRKGNRPGFTDAADPEKGKKLYEEFIHRWNQLSPIPAQTGRFGAEMEVALLNHGPVTLIIDSVARE